MSTRTLVILMVCFASITLADDFKTINGKEYKNARVTRVEADGIVLITKWGISKIYFSELPEDVQARFGRGPAKIEAKSPIPRTGEEKVERVEQQKKPQEPTLFIKAIALITGVIAPLTHGVWIVLVIVVGLFFVFCSEYGWYPQDRRSCHFCFQFVPWLDFSRLGARAGLGLHQRSCA